MPHLSDSMAELSQRAKTAEQHTSAAVKETRDQIERRIADVKANAVRLRDDFRAHRAQTEGDLTARWATVRSGVHDHFNQMRKQLDEVRDDHDAKVAGRRADWAETNAGDAIDFAAYAIEEAEASVLEATEARVIADSLG